MNWLKLELAALWAVIFLIVGAAAAQDAQEPAAASQPTAPASPPAAAGAPRFSAALPGGANVALIKIDGMIYDFTLESLKSRVDRAVQGGASLIVLELDTNGGLVSSAMDISIYIKTIPLPTLAWVNNKAYSAGILIASSCNAIVMAPSSAMGDCAPIAPGQSLAPTERAKLLSPILTEFRDNARRNGYDYTLFHAMCELGVEVFEIENPRDGERRLVNQADYEILVRGASPDAMRQSARTAAPTTSPAATPDEEIGGGGFMPEETFSESQRGAWRLVRQVHDGKSLLTIHQNEALSLGVSRGIVRNEAELKQFLNASSVTSVDLPWVEGVAYWLTRPWVRAILVMILLVGGYFELQVPGLGLGGVMAAIALILLLVAPVLVGLAAIWQLLLFGLGFVLLLIELFVIPGFGIVGILGIVFMFIGLVLSVVPTSGNGPISLPPPEMWRRLQESVMWTMIGVIFSGVGFYYITRYFGHLPLLNRLVLKTPSAALPQAEAALPVSGEEVIGSGRIAVGHTGQAISQLRPSGRASIDGQVIDVVTLGSWIEPGSPVRVVEVAGNRIVVDKQA